MFMFFFLVKTHIHLPNFPQKNFRYYVKRILLFLLQLSIFFLINILIIGAFLFNQISNDLPSPTLSAMLAAPQSTRILDRNGKFLYEVHGDIKRTPIPLSEIPQYVREATIAIEDKNFYTHHGFDPLSIIRAVIINYRHGETKQGASTITQQLSRVAFLNNEKTLSRKIKELILAIKIDYRFSKDEILELYLNNIPYGSNAYGVEAASNIYFGKHAKDLTLTEAAYLAALPKAPTSYSPYGPNAKDLDKRARLVLQKMQELGYLNPAIASSTLNQQPIKFKKIPTVINAPHFVFYVIDELVKTYGEEKIRAGGLTVYTSLDLALQKEAERIVKDRGEKNEQKFQASNAALVGLNPKNGEIITMVGSRNYFKPGDGAFNVAISPRQPGSSFKPYVYATAFANGMNPATMIMDTRTDFAAYNNGVSYVPRNYSGKNYGAVSIRQALAGSLNIPAVKTLVLTGINKCIDTAEKMGLTTLKDRKRFGPAIVLGGAEVKLLEHTAAFGTFGTGGIKQDLNPILKIIDRDNKIIFEEKKEKGKQVVDPQVAYLINNILSDNKARQFIFGRRNKLEIPGRTIAVKTGTSQDFHDAWTVGYTPSLAVGVWVGNNNNDPMKKGADGSVVAAPIWREFITKALASSSREEFARPKGIVEMAVDRVSGKLPTKYTPSTKKEVFASFNVPKDYDNIHLATSSTSPSKSSLTNENKNIAKTGDVNTE